MTEIILDEPLSPAHNSFLDEEDDESHKCRRCDLPISEGHAYELGGDRWHMYCFSCSKCSKLLGTSSNFLVLGTGDLICSECSYACNACGKKIDDLAILTGEQAYCSSCFCCRNCKKRIEDLRYARTSKGLFCMSCHEKLLEKKRRHDLDKKQSKHISHTGGTNASHRSSRYTHIDKSLPKIPNGGLPLSADSASGSITSGDASEVSTPGVLEVSSTVATAAKIPQRSPKRKPAKLSDEQQHQPSLDPPVSVSPYADNYNPRAKSPLPEPSYFDSHDPIANYRSNSNTTPSQHYVSTTSSLQTTPNLKSEDNINETPRKQKLDHQSQQHLLSENTPLKQAIISPNGKNRQAVIVDNLSSSSSNNILSSYISHESPPPKIPVPQLPGGDDFIDMNDSSDDDQISKYAQEPSGFHDLRQANHVPTGLNIQGIPSLNENDSINFQPEQEQQQEQQPEIPNTPNHGYRSWKFGSSSKSDANGLLSPSSPSPGNFKKSALANITNESGSGVSRSKSIRSPKSFLSFRKHKKSASGSSVEPTPGSASSSTATTRGKYYSPLMDGNPRFENLNNSAIINTPKFNTHTRGQSDTSPYQGAALFTTPPVPSHHKTGSVSRPNTSSSSHYRSVSDANATSSYQNNHESSNTVPQVELELRSLRTEIFDLKQTKGGLRKEITDLTSQRDGLNLEVLQLNSRLEQLKISFEQQQQESQQLQQQLQQEQQQQHLGVQNDIPAPSEKSVSSESPLVTVLSPPQDQINTAEQVDTKQKPKARFWRRNNVTKGLGNVFNKNEAMSASQSSYSLSNILNDGGSSNKGNPQISAPLLRNEETDELGGNDNKKLINGSKSSNYIDLGTSSSNSTKSNNSNPTLIMSDLFNSTLEMRTIFEKRSIPLIITRLVKEVETRGLDSEGIYRKNGGTLQMNNILKAFNNLLTAETSQELENSLEGDINAITSSLKRYLYFHLPEPIITMNVYELFIKNSQIEDSMEKIENLSNILSQLPKTNLKTLRFLLNHIKKIESYQHLNKMTFHNLAVVFAPTFTRVSSGERELMDMQPRNNVTEFLLVNQDEIFGKIDID